MKPKILTIVCLFMVIVTALAGCSGETPSPGTLTTTPTGAAPTISTPPISPAAETLEDILKRGASLTDFRFNLTGTIPDMPAGEIKMSIKGLKARIDVTADGQPVALIFDTATNIQYTYIPAQKVAQKASLADNDVITNFSPGKIAGEILRQKPSVLGTETLDGKATLKIQGTGDNGEKYNAWISKEYGIPLKLASAEPGNNMIIEWKNIDVSSIPDSVFEIPGDVKIILPDTTPPTVSSTSPAPNSTGIMVNTPITITFSEEMNASALTQANVILKSNDKAVSGNVTCKGNTATFTPAGELAYSTTYTITVTKQAKDLAGNGLSAEYSWSFKTRDAGILEGALNYVGEYPKPALVTYTDKSNKQVSVTAYPGQVQVYYDSKSTASDVEAMLKSKGGEVIGKIPLMGYYLVQVAAGKEAAFIASLQTDAKLKMAIPNIALSLESDGVVINEDFVNQRIPVPLNITGPVIVDAGDHADELLEAARELGGDIKNLVEISDVSDGYFGADKITMTLAAIAQGSKIFDPGKPVYINLSDGAGAKINKEWVDYKTLDTPAKQQSAITSWKDALLGKLQTLDSLPEELRMPVTISQSAGNCNMPLDEPLQEIRIQFPVLGDRLRDSVAIYSNDRSPANLDRTRYPSGKMSNFAVNDNDVIAINNTKYSQGTSALAVVGLVSMMKYAEKMGGLTPSQVYTAIKMAAITNNHKEAPNDSVISNGQKINLITGLMKASGATDKQVFSALWLAFAINSYSFMDVIPQDVQDALDVILLAADDPPEAKWITGITVSTQNGTGVTATITPAIAGVTVQYTVTGKNPETGTIRTYNGSKKTDASGRISFTVPAGACEETYYYSVMAVLRGKSATTQFMFYYD